MADAYLTYDGAPAAATVPLTMVVCPDCGQTVYEEDCIISRDPEGSSLTLCVDCHQKRPAKVRKQRALTKKAERWREVVRAIGHSSAPTISDLCLALSEKFGGVGGFAQFYYDCLCKAAINGPGSSRVLAGCAGVAKIIAASTVYQASLPEVGRLSDQQLCAEWEQAMKDMMTKIPRNELRELIGDVQREKARGKVRPA